MTPFIVPYPSRILGAVAKSFFTKPLTLDRVEQFLEADPSCVERFDNVEQTPLLIVLKNKTCSVEIVQLLLQYNSNINYKDFWGDSSLFVALLHNRDEAIIRVLLENNASFCRNKFNQSNLCIAVHREATMDVIQLLLDTHLPRFCLNHGSLLHCVLDCPSRQLTEELLDMLIAGGEDLNSLDAKGSSPLCVALQSGEKIAQDIELLLSKGVSMHACEKHGSPMLCATDGPDHPHLRADVVQLLLEKGAAMHHGSGLNALQRALLGTYYDMKAIRLMVDHKSFDASASCGIYGNLLQLAVRNCCCKVSVLQLLLDKGVSAVEANSPSGRTLMEVAVTEDLDCSILKLFFAYGARIDALMIVHDISLLQFAFYKYLEEPSKRNVDRYKLLLKWSCLQNLNRDLGLNAIDHWEFLRFAADCNIELRRMKKNNLDYDRTLQDFAGNYNSTHDDVHEVVRILSKNVFPIYFDTIVAKVARVSIEKKLLQEVPVYTIKNCTVSAACTKRCKVVLDYVTLSNITQHLSSEELMQLILAYFNY